MYSRGPRLKADFRTTSDGVIHAEIPRVSIHALREESDMQRAAIPFTDDAPGNPTP